MEDVCMVGIYKIENLINGKCYIGQAVNIQKRWNVHKNVYIKENDIAYNYPLYRAFRKYGIDNFDFAVLEECRVEDLNTKEVEYIKQYDSFFSGYNQTLGGDTTSVVDKEKVIGIIHDLETTNMYHKDIATKWEISTEMVQGINTGRYWKHDREYPIQTVRKPMPAVKHYCCDCGAEVFRQSKRCVKCENARRKAGLSPTRPDKDTLFSLLLKHKNFLKIGSMFGVTDNAVRKWCRFYGIPDKTTYYKQANT